MGTIKSIGTIDGRRDVRDCTRWKGGELGGEMDGIEWGRATEVDELEERSREKWKGGKKRSREKWKGGRKMRREKGRG